MSFYHLKDTQSIFKTLEMPPNFNVTQIKNQKNSLQNDFQV